MIAFSFASKTSVTSTRLAFGFTLITLATLTPSKAASTAVWSKVCVHDVNFKYIFPASSWAIELSVTTGFLITSYKFTMLRITSILEIAACETRSLSLFATSRTLAVVEVATLTFRRLSSWKSCEFIYFFKDNKNFRIDAQRCKNFCKFSSVLSCKWKSALLATNLFSATLSE